MTAIASTRLVWLAVGSPEPCTTDGTRIQAPHRETPAAVLAALEAWRRGRA